MTNFASIFQQFRNPSSSQLGDLLQQPTTSIERLLDEDCFLSEFRTNNPQLLEYMKYDKYRQLLELVSVVGPEDEQKRSYQYPYAAAEILSVENQHINEVFLPETPLFIEEVVFQEVEIEVQEEGSVRSETSFRSSIGGSDGLEKFSPQEDREEQTGTNDLLNLDTEPDKGQTKQPIQVQKKQPSASDYQTPKLDKKFSDITPDDFPDFQPRKMVKVKETIRKTIKKQVPPLIHELFDYFYGQVNYTLAGYICRIANSLICKKPEQFCAQFFRYTSTFFKKPSPIYIQILKHIQSKSVSQLIVKILTIDTRELYLREKEEIVWVMVNSMSIDSSLQIVNQVVSTLTEIIIKVSNNNITVLKANNNDQNRQENLPESVRKNLLTIFSIDFLKKLVQITLDNDSLPSGGVSGAVLLAYLKNIEPPSKDNPDLLISYQQLVDCIVSKGIGNILDEKDGTETQIQIPKQVNGVTRFTAQKMRILQCISYLMCNNVLNCCDSIPAESISFSQKLLKRYPWNSIVHNQVVKIVTAMIEIGSNSSSSINNSLKNLLEKGSLLSALSQGFKSKKTHGYFGHLLKISTKLLQQKSKNFILHQLLDNQQWKPVLTEFLAASNQISSNSLGGFMVRKQYQCQIMFRKEDILLKFDAFLKGENGKELNMDDFDFPDGSESSSTGDIVDKEEFNLEITEEDHQKYMFDHSPEKYKPSVEEINQRIGTDESEKALKEIQKNSETSKQSDEDNSETYKSVFAESEPQTENKHQHNTPNTTP